LLTKFEDNVTKKGVSFAKHFSKWIANETAARKRSRVLPFLFSREGALQGCRAPAALCRV